MFKKAQIKALLFGSIMIGSMAAVSAPAMATNKAMLDLLKILHDRGSISQHEYELLVSASKADAEKIDGTVDKVKDEVKQTTKDLPKITTKGKLEFKKGDNKIRIGGRLMADTTFGLGDVNFAGEGGSPVTEFRRARIYVSGTFQKLWDFKFQYDFAGQSASRANTNSIKAAYIAYNGFKPVTIKFGHHKTPLSLENLTSSKYMTFIERSQLVNGIVDDVGGGYQYAVSAHSYFKDMFTAAGAIYAGTANEDTAKDAFGFTGRLTFSPIHEKTRMVHLGIGFDHSKDVNGGFGIDAEPEVHPGADILENEATDFKTANTWVFEATAIHGPWSVQAEYASASLGDSRTPNSPDIDADAWYIYGSYYFTGESRNYKWKQGSYSQTKVKNPLHKGGYGAWEAALRYTSGDYENVGGAVSSEAEILTAGLNWYPSNNIRFSANYVNVLDANAAANEELAGELAPGATADNAEYLILRGQWYF